MFKMFRFFACVRGARSISARRIPRVVLVRGRTVVCPAKSGNFLFPTLLAGDAILYSTMVDSWFDFVGVVTQQQCQLLQQYYTVRAYYLCCS